MHRYLIPYIDWLYGVFLYYMKYNHNLENIKNVDIHVLFTLTEVKKVFNVFQYIYTCEYSQGSTEP